MPYTLLANVDCPIEAPPRVLEIIQGSDRQLTFVVIAEALFDNASASSITIRFTDVAGGTLDIPNGQIVRILQQPDIQVIRISLNEIQTAQLVPGMLQVEISFDNQKAHLNYHLKVLEAL